MIVYVGEAVHSLLSCMCKAFINCELLHAYMCRHTEEMIEKLESAGLGFYIKAKETQQKLGEFTIFFGSTL